MHDSDDGDDLDHILADALGAERLPAERAAAMARTAQQADRRHPQASHPQQAPWRLRRVLLAAAAALLVALAIPVLLPDGPAPVAIAQTYAIVARGGHLEVLVAERRLSPGQEIIAQDGQYLRVGSTLVAPGGRVRLRADGEIEAEAATDSAARYLAGLQHFTGRRWDEAAEALAGVDTADGRFYLIGALGNGGRIEQAVHAAESFLADHPEHIGAPLAHYFLGVYLRQLGRDDEADEAFEELRRLHPDSELAHAYADERAAERWRECQQVWQERDFARGRTLLEAFVHDHPDSAMVENGAAAFLLFACVGNSGDGAHAIELADEFVTRHSSHPSCDYVLYFQAVYLFRAGDSERATRVGRRILDTYPDSAMRPHVRTLLESNR